MAAFLSRDREILTLSRGIKIRHEIIIQMHQVGEEAGEGGDGQY
jgi:hypothetical protein